MTRLNILSQIEWDLQHCVSKLLATVAQLSKICQIMSYVYITELINSNGFV